MGRASSMRVDIDRPGAGRPRSCVLKDQEARKKLRSLLSKLAQRRGGVEGRTRVQRCSSADLLKRGLVECARSRRRS